VRQLSPRENLQAQAAGKAMMKINEVTAFKIPPDKTEADITKRALIDEGVEETSRALDNVFLFSMPKAEANMCFHRSTIDTFVAPKKRPPDVDESTLSLKDLLEDAKLKDYIVIVSYRSHRMEGSPMPRIFSTTIRNVWISWLHKTGPRMGLWPVGSRM
jgi:hypothetical protein